MPRLHSVLRASRQRCLVGQAMALALWNAPAFAQNLITPDGRTQTNVAVSGTTTTITTQTVSGGAGYNSFSHFEQVAGTTVNMHLPQNTGVLVNIVRNGPVVIDGILNSYRNGRIDGHVYFSDSAGFTVGPNGVINTGQLTVNTPTRDFLERVISPNGVVDEGLAARLKANDIPVSPDGRITIDGTINARRGVTLNGHTVSVAGQIRANAAPVDIAERRQRHRTAFSESVNTTGLRHGGAMVARKGGGIEIVAAGTVSISGRLSANATGRRAAGTVTVRSAKGVTIAPTARITATGAVPSPRLAGTGAPAVNTGDGGKVSITSGAAISMARGAVLDVSAASSVAAKAGSAIVFAGTNLDVADGAIFRGTAGTSGDGGFLELSAKQTVTVGAVDVDLSARNGKAGLLFIDPTDIVIGSGGSANMITNGTNVSLLATNSITVRGDGLIDTRQFNRSANGGALSASNPSTGNSGNITLEAPKIEVAGRLLAGVSTGSSFSAGNVTLTASQSQTLLSGAATAEAGIKVSGTITGRDVVMTADARAVSSFIDPNAGTLVALAAQTLGGAMFGLNGSYVGSTIASKIEIASTAVIEATRNVSLSASGRQEASLPAITLSGNFPWGAAVSIGEIAGEVKADVASGARITVGGNLEVRASNDVKLGVTALTLTTGQSLVAATVAYGAVDVTTAAKVHSGALITAGSSTNVTVSALTTNSFSTSATAMASAGSVGGIAFAYSDYKAATDAQFGASLGSAASKAGSLTVQAVSDTTKNATSATTTVGNNALFNAGPAGSTASDLLTSILGKVSNGSSTVPAKVGSAIAIADSSLSAKAVIGADAGGAAPAIYTNGNVAVASRQSDFGVRLIADSSTNSNSTDPTAANPQAQVSLSFGIAVGNYDHQSTASIGSGATVSGSRVGVGATNEMPISNTWTNWAGLAEAISHLNGNLGVVNNILTTYANASSQSNQLGLAGAVDYFRVNNETSAYIASGATITAASLGGAWQTTLADGYDQAWSRAVSVSADTTVHSIDGGGNFGFTGGVQGGAGSAAGGTLLDIGRSSRTVAAIADGVTVTAGDLGVTATTSDKMFVVATSSGRSAGVALNGMVSLAGLNNQTLASISNRALITADLVDLRAEQFVSLFSLGGALAGANSGGSSFGVSVARLDATTVTRAFIGDNSGDLSDDRLRGDGTTLGLIRTDSLTVQAATTGRVIAASVAAAAIDFYTSDGAIDFLGDDPFFAKVASATSAQGGGSPSLGLAGSAAMAATQLGTSAWIDGARIENRLQPLTTAVRALNSSIIEIGSGSAAINLSNASAPSAALAGAIAYAKLDNSTDAHIAGSTLTNIGNTTVQALAGGRITAVGLGLAGSGSGNGAAAMSVSLGLVTDRVSAAISDSTLLASTFALGANAVAVNAYQTTDIGIGGGAAYAGAKNGIGLALTYTEIADPDGEDAVSARVTRSRLDSVRSLSVTASGASRIVSSAISAGLGGNGLAGSLVFNTVTPTIRALIDGSTATPALITTRGDVLVLSDGSRDATLDALITGRQLFAGTDTSQIDFTGSAANDGTANPTSAAIVAIAGAAQGGTNNVGVSLLVNRIAQSHLATIDQVNLTAGGLVTVRAQDGATITGVAVGLGVATGAFAGTASVVLQSIGNIARAGIAGSGTSITAANLDVTGTVASAIRASAGSLGIGVGTAAVGLSVVESDIANEADAAIANATIRASGDVVLRANSTATIDTLAIGIAMSRNVGLAGSVANNSIATDVAATVTGADIVAGNNLGLFAANTDRITVSAGALGATLGAPSVAGGLSVVNNSIGGATTASIGAGSTVDARAGGSGALSYQAGQLVTAFDLSTATNPSAAQPSLAMASRSIRGLGVVATSQQSVLANAVTGGVAIFPVSGAVAIVPIRNVLGGSTSAVIDASAVNTRLSGTDSTAVAIEAASHSYAATFITVGSIGGVAAAGADANTVMQRSTRAALTGSTLGTTTPGFTGAGVTALDIAANASQSATGTVIGFAVGLGGAAASGIVNGFAATTTATLDQGLVTAGRVAVNAESRNGFYGLATVAAGGSLGLGSAFTVGTSRNTTLATIGGGAGQTTLNLNGALAVAARSANDFTLKATGGAAGGFAGVAGMVNFIDVENETRAGLYGVVATLRPAGAAGIAVTATETTRITPTTAAGATGSMGAGAAATIASLDSRVLADITGSTLSAPGAVSAAATSERVVDARTVTLAVGGTAGIGASVAVISVGTGTPAGAAAELNANGDGTLARVSQLTAGNADLVLSASGLAAYRSYRGTAGASMTDAALRDAAQAEFDLLLANGTVANGALMLGSSGVTALRSAAATALGIASPSDAQVRNWATQRYAALTGGSVAYLMSDAGVSAYRATVAATLPGATDDQIRSAANDAYARLLANGTVSNGVLTLSTAGLAAYRTEASASLGRTATDAEVRSYAAQQYSFFTANRSRIVAPASQSASALLDSADSRTAATVTGGSIASGLVTVGALSQTTTSNLATGVGAGAAAGVGAATAYTTVGDRVSATLDQLTVTTGSIALSARSADGSGSAAAVESRAGAGALGAAAGAAVAEGTLSNTVAARLGGTLTVTGATSVTAENSQTGRSDAFGATVAGGLALGVSLAKSSAASTISSELAAGASLTGTGLTIGATSTGAAHAAAVAGVGGLLAAGAGAEATATDSTDVLAVIRSGARAQVGTGAITVRADASPDAKASATGVAVAGALAVGTAIANATVNPVVRAMIEGNASLPSLAQFTAGTLSVRATGSVFGTALGDAVDLSDSTAGFARGGLSAAASALAASGAYYVSATGTRASANNTSRVAASVGNHVRLPAALVTVAAGNTTAQGATASGVSGGIAAIGVILAEAGADTTTTASLGNGVRMEAGGSGSLAVTATGSDTQIVRSQAGSGGLFAGSGAEGKTSAKSAVTASLGSDAVIDTGLITIAASHDTRYAALVDSLQAAALGASAALAANKAEGVTVLTSLGARSRLTAAGPGTAGCSLTSCLQAISLTSRNAFEQLDLGASVQAAAGGGINGAGATSTTDLSGTSRVMLGDDVVLVAGTSPTGAPGPILIQAWSELTGDDTATLTTGGLLQGAGVTTRYTAEVDNAVTLGLRSTVTSFGVINLGTYTTADVRANAYVSTYGLAGVGVADADVTVKTNNGVTIGANAMLLGLGDVNVTAGRDGSGLVTNSLTGRATALGYVRGLIAVPDADASTDLQNHARVEVASGASIASAQNVTLGAYDGLLNANADGTGHGYQLFFIPVTNGSSSPGASSSSTLVMNGTATAGIYNTQRIEIGCGTNAAQQCGVNDTPTIRFVSGAPVTANYNTAFDAVSYINARYDASVASTLISGVSGAPVKAVRLSQLYAAGGNVYVGGRTVSGGGTLTARGGPSITVINRSNAYLVLDGGAYIPESTGGQIVGASGGLTRNSNPDATPVITIDNTYSGALDASGNGPGLLIAGDVTNLAGVVSINNTLGSFGFSGQRIDALQFNVTVPNGAVAVSSNGPNGLYNAGASPQADYGSYIVYPGGGPGASLNANEAIYAAANALAAAAGSNNLNYFLYGTQADGATRNWSLQFFGNCAGYIADSGYNCTGGYSIGNAINFMVIPTVPTYRTSSPVAQGGGTQIYGAQVAIKATTININASIEAGRITNWSGNIAANIGTILGSVRQGYLDAGMTSASFASIFGGGWAAPGAAPVVYDVVNHRLILNDVNASSGGGSVLLDGQIISTNTLGRIKVNGGFGDVSLVNNSGLDLVTSRINTGTAAGVNASVSKITIVDRLITSGPNTTVYAYTPGSGIAVYKTNNGTQPVLGTTTPVAFISGDTTSYAPVAGTRYEWTQQALLEKVGLTVANRNQRDVVSYWVYSSGTSSNPWVYVDAQSPSTNPGADPRYWWSRSAQAPSGTPVSGRLTNNLGLTQVGLTQEITGGHLDFINNSASYGGCQGGSPNYCDRGFVGQPGASQAVWDYNYATRAFVQVTASVKADNPFAISFAGNAAGRVNIQTNGGILLQGNVVNPSGTTTLTATGGGITQGANASILSNSLTLTSRDTIGTAAQAIQATLTSGAQLSATTGSGGIHLDITGGARITTLRADGNPSAYGDVVVRATGGLEAAAQSGANVIGRNITLSSENGGIGSLNNLMKLQAVATRLPNGTFVDGVVNVSALGDIGVAQLAGDLRVGEIRSHAGNVRIDVNAGRLVSATGQTSAQALSAEQLSQVSRALKLTAGDGAAAAAQASIATFETQVTQAYGLYAALIRNGSVDGNGIFRLSDAAVPLYQAFADAALGRTASAQEVKDYAAARYTAYAGAFETAYGAGWSTQARFQPATLQSNYSFRTTDADAATGLATRIAGDAVWTDRQLVSAINQSALQPASGVVGNGTALVIGHDVTLNIAGSIGSLAPDMAIALSDIRNGSISSDQLAALAVATTPGTVKIMGQRPDGSLVEVADLNQVPAGVTLVRVDVKQTTPLFINATGTFSGSAQGDVYVQSTGTPNSAGGTLTIGRVTATGTVNLQAPQAITVATAAGGTTPRNAVQIQTGGDLVLVAGGGGIGSASTSLVYQIGGRLVSASAAAGDVHMVAETGTAQIGRIFASGTVSLTAGAGGIQGYLPGVAISANAIQLNTSGDVGSGSAPLAVQLGAAGDISGRISGSAWLAAPTIAGQSPNQLRLGALAVDGGLVATSDGGVEVLAGLRSAQGGISLTGATIAMASGSEIRAAGAATLSSAGSITLGKIVSTLAAPVGGASITLTAASTILGNGDAGTLLDAGQTGGVVSLLAGGDIGSASAPLALDAPTLSARSLNGHLDLVATTVRATSLAADVGGIALRASGSLAVDSATSAAGTRLSAANGALTTGTLLAGTDSTLNASGLVTITSATATSGDLAITSTGAGITAATLLAGRDATLNAATAVSVTTSLTAGRIASVTAAGGTLGIATLLAGTDATLNATGAVTLGSATATTGDLAITSTGAGITATTLLAGRDATLNAATAVSVTTSLTAGRIASVTAAGGTLGIATLLAGTDATLNATGAVTLGSATATTGDLAVTSTGAGITLTGALTAGGAATLTAQNGALQLASLRAGTATLSASGAVTLTSATTTAGALTIASTGAGIAAGALDAAGAANLTAATGITLTGALTAGGLATLTAQNGALQLASLRAGTATLSASGAVTLTSATTTVGDLTIASTGGGITAGALDAAGDASLTAATGVTLTGGLIAGGAATLSAQNGALQLASLRAGTATLSASGAVALTSATTTAGALTIASTGGGITAGALDAAGDASLTAMAALTLGDVTAARDLSIVSTGGGLMARSVRASREATISAVDIDVTGSFAAGGRANLTARAGALRLAGFQAGDDARLSATGAVVLGTDVAAAGDLSVSGAVIEADALSAGRSLDLSTSGAITLAAARAGHDVVVRAEQVSAGAVAAGRSVAINAGGAVALAMVDAETGGLSIVSQRAGIAATRLDAAGGAVVSATGDMVLGSVAARDLQAVSTAGSLAIGSLASTGTVTLSAAATLDGGRILAAGSARLDAGGRLDVARLSTGGDLSLASASGDLAVGDAAIDGSATLVAAGAITVQRLSAADALVVEAGRSGVGSVTIEVGAARRATFTAPDAVRLGRFGAGESITILGTRIAADIVRLPSGGTLPLQVDIGGARARTAETVELGIDAPHFESARFDATDARLTTSAQRLDLRNAFVPGRITLTTPVMSVLSNNRSPIPSAGFDVQLFPNNRSFFVAIDGKALTTNAFIVRFDASVADIPPSSGASLTFDMERLGPLLGSAPSFRDAARSFVFGPLGLQPGQMPGLDGMRAPGLPLSQPLVNLGETEDQP
ncbi:MAG: leukotoxin LktA family filamentous adhesin [Beijerinckiaceae bacterium]|nr:leukotoxin LktA family filamentous adhesin [Beijerinckiaceae bacterium]